MSEPGSGIKPAASSPPPSAGGLPPVEIMQRMLDLQERRLELDGRQMEVNERELVNNHALGMRSLELSAVANSEHTNATVRVMGWRYSLAAVVGVGATIAVIFALYLNKEGFLLEALKYVLSFIGGYGAKAVVDTKKKPPDAEGPPG